MRICQVLFAGADVSTGKKIPSRKYYYDVSICLHSWLTSLDQFQAKTPDSIAGKVDWFNYSAYPQLNFFWSSYKPIFMKLLLVAATQFEVQPFLDTAPPFDVLITGIGIAATTYRLTKHLQHKHYGLVIQAGIAGVFEKAGQPAIGEVVTVAQDCFGDMGVLEGNTFSSIQQMGFSSEPEWLTNENRLLGSLPYKQVSAITVNLITDNPGSGNPLFRKWKADIESMEGAAFHFVCRHQQVNFLQVRAISNITGIRDKSQWKLTLAINNLNEALKSLQFHL